ncbi:hypothetical protein QBC39DRAFT_38440 [Podospora conica]|nr:hypothetical protein QBC39DRAFT_38440 [Schizothecium conicum]
MVSTRAFFVGVAALATVAYGAPAAPCKPAPGPGPAPKPTTTYVLPSTGSTDLTPPAAGLVLKRIAIGHGIQNYSCDASPSAVPVAKGALAVLYDATPLYPGTPKALDTRAKFDALSTQTLWTKAIPLNLANPAAAAAGAVLPSKQYGAAAQPWKAPRNLEFQGLPPIKFLGHHYFDAEGQPTFDLTEAGLKASVKKTGEVNQPANADAGPLGTGSVKWLLLEDNGKGLSNGVKAVYRVITAGGGGDACAKAGEGLHSVPYTAQYWFYG